MARHQRGRPREDEAGVTKYHSNDVRIVINGRAVHDDTPSITLSGGPMPTPNRKQRRAKVKKERKHMPRAGQVSARNVIRASVLDHLRWDAAAAGIEIEELEI